MAFWWLVVLNCFKVFSPDYERIWLRFIWAIHTAVTAVHFVCTAVINQPLTNLAVVANCPLRIKTSSSPFLWLILIFLLVVRFSWPLYPSNVPPHFELKSNEMADLKKKNNRRKKQQLMNHSILIGYPPMWQVDWQFYLPIAKFTRIWCVVGC